MVSRVRFLQCAGCRFDSPSWEGSEGWVTQRRQDLWQTFEAVLSLCRSDKVELLFLTGDIFEQEYVRKETVERVARSLALLKGTRIFIAPGAKDPLVATSAYRLAVWPSNVHIFSSGISSVKIPSLNVTIYGGGWTAYHQEGPFLEGFQVTRDETIPILLLHAELDSILPEHIAASGLAYLALGHHERWTGIQKAGETVWADSGFLEARSFAENGPHGVIMGKIEKDSVQLEFLELGQRHYIEKPLPIEANQTDIDALASEVLSEISLAERQKDLFRIKLSGPFREVEAVARPLQKLLEDKFRFVEVVTIIGETSSQFRLDVVTPSETMNGNRDKDKDKDADGYLTVYQLYINKLKERQFSAVNTENHEYSELVTKIGLAALGQGRIGNEN